MTILVIEDYKPVLHLVRDILEIEGYTVDLCENGAAALNKIQGSDHYDLILTDNDLPGINGLELIRHTRLLAHRRDVPIIMLSALPHCEDARRAGADEFLKKPEQVIAVAVTATRLLAARRSEVHPYERHGRVFSNNA